MNHYVGVDVGGTTTTVSIGNEEREVVFVSPQFDTRSTDGPEATIAAIVHEIGLALKHVGCAFDQVQHIGLATPGPATRDGVLKNSPNLDPKLWNNFAVRGALQASMQAASPGVVVHYIGDGQAAAFGEFAIRKGSVTWSQAIPEQSAATALKSNSLFMAMVGTGLGGGAVRRGLPVRGSQGRAGHAGHTFLPPTAFRHEHDRQLKVGNAVSTVESAVSLTALTHQLAHRLTLAQWKDHPLNASADTNRDKAKQLRELAADSDDLALELFDDQARALGIGLLTANYLGDYDLLVIGGGVCDMSDAMRQRYRQGVEKAYYDSALDGFRNLEGIEFSICGDEAAVVGALAHSYTFET
ncbi:ROK family protein [Planctomycetes bacterium K23_9]|uniref:Glucokinase n=1 Tax=Stieleria marina TaxID=1930275 RepID=A0A517NYI0_9BACT|nr:Glucokinase [Planctomycetes bacterium K23_9]